MSEIRTAEDAIRKADTFLDKYYLFHRLEGVKKIEGNWVLRYDVSVVGPKRIVVVKFNQKTGSLVEYISPDK
jgi:hypothetical protein